MNLVVKNIDELIPYENNPRNNDKAVDVVANSIKEFGFKVPIVIDKDNVVVTGHTRLKACKKLGITEVPCIIADDLSEEQITAFRLADNKTGELSDWDFMKLEEEASKLADIDLSAFGFEHIQEFDWDTVEDLTEEKYEEPEKNYLRCPHCGHVDTTTHFKKVSKDDELLEDE